MEAFAALALGLRAATRKCPMEQSHHPALLLEQIWRPWKALPSEQG